MKSKYKSIYVLLPHNYATGGVELGHQLVDYLRQLGIIVYAVYMENGKIVQNPQILDTYRHYNIQITTYIEDKNENIIVIPETMPELARRYHQIDIAFWWMSVDNFFKHYLSCSSWVWNKEKSFWENLRKNTHILLSHLPFASTDILVYFRRNKHRIIHLYQSEYAHQYILNHRLGECKKLSDYINPDLFPKQGINHNLKQDIVLFNPKKGYEYTKKIIEALPHVKFVALQDMNRNQLNEAFDSAKLYVDFGHFPGKDRLPREAVLHDCCILTGRFGASQYYEDVPIGDNFKYDITTSNIQQIANQIIHILDNYEDMNRQFDLYRKIVADEQNLFYGEIENIFCQ